MIACPDCGTPNKADADLCVQCWREMTDGAVSRIPVAAFAVSAPAPAAPPPPVVPPRYVAPSSAPETVKPREAEAGPVPYFAPVGSTPSTSLGFPLPSSPSTTTTTTTRSAPWGGLIALALLLAFLGGGYYFFFGKSSGGFTASDGAFTIELPDGWERMEEQEAVREEIDFVVHPADNEQTMIMAAHTSAPVAQGDQARAVLGLVQQFVPKVPGLTMSPVQDSTLVTGEGVSSYEMTATASGPLAPNGGKMRVVMVVDSASSNLVFLMVACAGDECSTAEPKFQEMAETLKFSG